jgi:hypothetical protein
MLKTIDDLKGVPHTEDVTTLRKLSDVLNIGLKNYNKFEHTRAPALHASELAHECARVPVFSLLNTPRTAVSAIKWKKIFSIGHVVHNFVQDVFATMCGSTHDNLVIHFEPEVRINADNNEIAREWGISSSCDGVITLSDAQTGEVRIRSIVEIKSMSPDTFETLRKPSPEHVEQAHIYMKCLDIPYCWYIYWNKGNQLFTNSYEAGFLAPYQQHVWDKLVKKMESAHMYAGRGELPERVESIACEFCPFRETCKPDYLVVKPHAIKNSKGFIR